MLIKLWIAAFSIRLLALCFAVWRKAPLSWIIWTGFVEVLDAYLFSAYFGHSGSTFTAEWTIQQLGSVVLLAFVVRRTAYPTSLTVSISIVAAVVVAGATALVRMYPKSHVEPVMEIAGCCLLAMGIMATITALAMFDWQCGILAGYLLCSAILNLSGNEWLKSPTLGRAVELLECIAFSAWALFWVLRRKSSNVC